VRLRMSATLFVRCIYAQAAHRVVPSLHHAGVPFRGHSSSKHLTGLAKILNSQVSPRERHLMTVGNDFAELAHVHFRKLRGRCHCRSIISPNRPKNQTPRLGRTGDQFGSDHTPTIVGLPRTVKDPSVPPTSFFLESLNQTESVSPKLRPVLDFRSFSASLVWMVRNCRIAPAGRLCRAFGTASNLILAMKGFSCLRTYMHELQL